MTKRQIIDIFVFAFITGTVCLLLAMRPIPSIFAPNDTGRYIIDFMAYCSIGIEEKPTVFQDISYNVYFMFLWPACWTGEGKIQFMLFAAAAALPISMLLFSNWRNGALIWAFSLFFSVYGLELMANALRQNFATLFYFAAFVVAKKHRVHGLLLGVSAVLVHTSAAAFFPMLLWISQSRMSKKMWVFVIALSGLIAFSDIRQLRDMGEFYTSIYSEGSSLLFDMYIIMPLYFFYFIRRVFDAQSLSVDERKCVRYSSVVLVVALMFFPAVAYRFALFAVPVQLFAASNAENRGSAARIYTLVLSLAHLATIFLVSDQYQATFYG